MKKFLVPTVFGLFVLVGFATIVTSSTKAYYTPGGTYTSTPYHNISTGAGSYTHCMGCRINRQDNPQSIIPVSSNSKYLKEQDQKRLERFCSTDSKHKDDKYCKKYCEKYEEQYDEVYPLCVSGKRVSKKSVESETPISSSEKKTLDKKIARFCPASSTHKDSEYCKNYCEKYENAFGVIHDSCSAK